MPKSEKTALMYAVDLLARQEQSSKKIREKLKRKGYGDEETEAAIQRLEEKRYLNDGEACARQFRFLYTESRNSVKQICVKLMQRGFERSMITDCVPRDTYQRELTAALRCLSVKFKPSSDGRKMMANLCGKGFEVEVARAAVEQFAASSFPPGTNIVY